MASMSHPTRIPSSPRWVTFRHFDEKTSDTGEKRNFSTFSKKTGMVYRGLVSHSVPWLVRALFCTTGQAYYTVWWSAPARHVWRYPRNYGAHTTISSFPSSTPPPAHPFVPSPVGNTVHFVCIVSHSCNPRLLKLLLCQHTLVGKKKREKKQNDIDYSFSKISI